MKVPCLVQTVGDAFQQFRTDVDHQNGQKGTVEADRQPWTEKIISHDDHQDQHAGKNKAVIHSLK